MIMDLRKKYLPKHDVFGSPIAYDAHKFGEADRKEFPREQDDEKDIEIQKIQI